MLRIHQATESDRDRIYHVHLSAFPENERETVARLAVDLLDDPAGGDSLALIAEFDGEVAGHVAFSPVTFEGRPDLKGYILAPLGVVPGFQQQGVGSALVRAGIRQLSEDDVDIVFVYGDPKYYGRFGFEAEIASGMLPRFELEYPFGWQAINPGEKSLP